MASSMFLEFAASAAGGAAVGWITNSLAVSMLFRKYGKWGGVIEERYEEFIENMAELVETDLINHRALQDEFTGPAFKGVLHSVIADMLLKELPARSGDRRLAELPGIDGAAVSLIGLLQTGEAEGAEYLYRLFADKPIQSLISKEQYHYLVDTHTGTLCSDARRQEIGRILHNFFADRPLTAFISPEAVDRITENITAYIERIDFTQFDRDIDAVYASALEHIHLDRIIADLETGLGHLRYADCIKDTAAFSQELTAQGIAFAESPEGQALLLETAAVALEEAKRIPLKITDAINPAVKDGIARFLNDTLPGIFSRIADFIDESSDEIEQIIDTAIDRHLEETADGFVLIGFKKLFIGDISKHFNVVEKIIQAVRTYGASDRFATEAAAFIDAGTVGTIVTLLQEQQILTPQRLTALINTRLPALKEKKEKGEKNEKKETGYTALFYTPIGNSFTPNLSILKTTALPRLLEQVKQEYLYRDAFKQDLRSKGIPQITALLNAQGSAFISAEKLLYAVKEPSVKQFFLKQWDKIGAIKIGDIFSLKTVKQIRIPWERLWNRLKQQKLSRIYQWAQNDQVYAKTAEGLLSSLNRHIDTLVTGNVSKLVDAELRKASPPQIRVMVQDFIGKELKPINAFGALLGALAGGVSAGAVAAFNLPREFSWPMLLLYGLIFTAVGIGTNWLAIKMLFRPYKKILFNVSPFIGIAALRQPEFAKSIGRFIKNHTFNDASLRLFFSGNKNAVQETLFNRIAAEDYRLVDTLLRDDERLAGFVCSAMRNYGVRHCAETASALETAAKDFAASENAGAYLPQISGRIMQKLREADPVPHLCAYLTEELAGENVGRYVETLSFAPLFERLSQGLTMEQVREFLYRQNDRFIAYTSSHSFEDFAGTQTTAKLMQGIAEKMSGLLQSAAGAGIRYLKDTQLTADTSLGSLFNRRLAGFLEKHIDSFLELIVQDIAKQKGALVRQIKDAMPWYAAPAKPHVAPIVAILIDEELPRFLKQKKTAILSIAESLLEYRLSDIGFSGSDIREEAVAQGAAALLASQEVQQRIGRFVEAVAEGYTKAPLGSALEGLGITEVKDLVRIAEPLLGPAVAYIKAQFLRDDVAALARGLLAKAADGLTVSELLAGVDLERELARGVAPLLQSAAVQEGVSALVLSVLSESARNGALYDSRIAQADIAGFIAAADDQDWELLRRAAAPMASALFRGLNKAVPAETKQAVCNEYLIPSALDTVEHRFTDIVAAVDIQKVVEQQVAAMHPKEIETLFTKFAGTYFTRIIVYGWIGLFGGLVSYLLGCLLKLF